MNNNLILSQISLEEMRQMLREEISVFMANVPPTETSSNLSKDLLTAEEASTYLNLAQSTIYRLVRQRDIPYMKRARKLYFSKEELRGWVEEGKKPTQAVLQAAAEIHLAQIINKKRSS